MTKLQKNENLQTPVSKKNLGNRYFCGVHTYVFNSSHDLALANNDKNYLPPESVKKMERDLALLPIWYAVSDASVLVMEKTRLTEMTHWLHSMAEKFDGLHNIELSTSCEHGSAFHPWGWNRQMVGRLNHLGASEQALPSGKQLDELRKYASREYAAIVLLDVREKLKDSGIGLAVCGMSTFCTTERMLRDALQKHEQTLVKAPWSGSGRGLRFGDAFFQHPFAGWCRHILAHQGGLVVEPFYHKVLDFALEFYADGNGHVSYMGLSCFSTSRQGNYEGNIVAPDHVLADILRPYLSAQDIRLLSEVFENRLSMDLGRRYRGYLGIDMMICRFDEGRKYRVHPCVELNLRYTMGIVARQLTRFIPSGAVGRFRLEYTPHPGEIRNPEMMITSDHRLKSGSLLLTPLFPDTQYCAKLDILPRIPLCDKDDA